MSCVFHALFTCDTTVSKFASKLANELMDYGHKEVFHEESTSVNIHRKWFRSISMWTVARQDKKRRADEGSEKGVKSRT